MWAASRRLVDGSLGGRRVVEALAWLALRGRTPRTTAMEWPCPHCRTNCNARAAVNVTTGGVSRAKAPGEIPRGAGSMNSQQTTVVARPF